MSEETTSDADLPAQAKPRLSASYNALATIVAIVTSAAALFIAWDHAQVMRAQQHGTVWPVLVINKQWVQTDTEVKLRFVTENSGVGPALVSSVNFIIDDKDIEDPKDIAGALFSATGPSHEVATGELRGRAIAPGKDFLVVGFSWKDLDKDQLDTLSSQWDEIGLKVCYCSVFDRCWVTKTTDNDLPLRVDHCPMKNSDMTS